MEMTTEYVHVPGTCDTWMVSDLRARRDAFAGAECGGRDLRKSLPRSARLRAFIQCRPHLNHRPLAGNNEDYTTCHLSFFRVIHHIAIAPSYM